MGFRTQMMDEDDVGKGSGDYFKPEKTKQKIALIPAFIPDSELGITVEEQNSPNTEIREQALHKAQMVHGLNAGLAKEPATVLRSTMEGQGDGYLFARTDSHYTHYSQSINFFLCKAAEYKEMGREATCCVKSDRDASLTYAFVVIRYDTDSDGNIKILDPALSQPLDAENVLNFKYSLMRCTFSDARMRMWKRFHGEFPPITSDFDVWMEKQGKSERINFSPCRDQALWLRRGPVLIQRILEEAAKLWPRAASGLGRDMPTDEIDQLYGVTPPSARASQEAKFGTLLTSAPAPAAPAPAAPAPAAPAPAPVVPQAAEAAQAAPQPAPTPIPAPAPAPAPADAPPPQADGPPPPMGMTPPPQA